MKDINVPDRKDIAREYTWNAESVFSNLQKMDAEYRLIQSSLTEISGYKGHLKNGPALLLELLNQRDEILRRTYVVSIYCNLTHEVDKTNQSLASLPGKAQSLLGQVLSSLSYIEPELIEIGQQTLMKWMNAEPGLKIYNHYFAELFRKQAHIRSGEVEELLGMLADPFASVSTTAGMLTDADLRIKPATDRESTEIEITQGNYHKLLSSPDRQIRRSAWENYTDAHLSMKNTLANNLVTSLKNNVFLARARRHPSTLEASLFEQNIPVEVFHNLIATYRKNLPIWWRYFQIRKRALGLDALQVYDMWAPLTQERPKVTFHESVDWICRGLAPLGQDYVNILFKGCIEDRWVDVYPNQGKASGAFSSGFKGTYPFIIMSFTDEITSFSTLAHELGHSMHSYLTWKTQPTIYSDYSIFVAEVASNFHQAMVRAYLLDNHPDRIFQISLIEEALANFFRYFFIMPTLARFELETHKIIENGEGLSAEMMNNLMADLFQEAYGGQINIDRQRYGITWATFPHLYMDYYVYQYATGISGAHAISQRILSGEKNAVEDYLRFLKSGSSQYPLEALKMAGVDLSSPKPVEDTFSVLEGYVDRLESLLS
jgi:oligoendopeptidase F